MGARRLFCVVLHVIFALGHVVCNSRVTLIDNGYSGIVVALDNDIDQIHEDTLIHNIQEMFTDASAFLYIATRQRAYFREVTILLPETWKRKNGTGIAGRETYGTSDVRVTHPNPSHLSKSHTVQASTICGQPGLYIHLNKDHLINFNSPQTLLEYGPPGRWLTRYWSHYRYGIFDEHGYPFSEKFPTYYGPYKVPTACVKNPLMDNGNFVNITTGKKCDLSTNNFLHCVYYPHPERDPTSWSISYNHSLPKVTHFCDDSKEFQHVAGAPTPHNAYCDKRSAWNVISQHTDFNNTNAPRDIADTTPSFRIVAPSEDLNIVLLFDISASTGATVLNLFRRASDTFLTASVPRGSVVGSVAFNKCAYRLKNMTKLLTSSDEKGLIPSGALRSACSTCIGCGIKVALEMLDDNRISAGSIVLILTDGRENSAPPIRDVLDDVVQAGVRVFTVVYGNLTADAALESLAEVSNGRTFFLPQQTSTLMDISVAMAAAIESRKRSVKVMDHGYSNRTGHDLYGSFVLDAASTTSVSFVTMYDIPKSLMQVTVLAPYQSQSQPALKATTLNNVFSFVVAKPQKGLWQYRLRMTSCQQNIGVSVTARHRSPKEAHVDAINTDGWINVNNQQITAKNTSVAFFAKVHQKEKPILKAHVFAIVVLPNGQAKRLQLLDNGIEPDLHANDGLYSRYFIEFGGSGRYSVRYDISSVHQPAYNVLKNSKQPQAFVMESRDVKNQHDILSPARSFQRSILVGSFTVLDDVRIVDNADVIPPNTIYDLKVVQIAEDLSHVILEWTAPGDDYDRGTATSYEVKYSDDPLQMTAATFGHNPQALTSNDVINGTLTPLPAGTQQKVTLRFPENQKKVVQSYFLSIRAVDDAGNVAKPSNFVQVFDPTFLEKCEQAGGLLPHPKACRLYLKCEEVGQLPIRMRCPSGKLFSSRISACDVARSVNCNNQQSV